MDWQAVYDFVFPPQCGGCTAPGSGLCAECLPENSECSKRLRTLHVRGLAPYDGRVRNAILALKSGRRDVARAFAQRLCRLIPPAATTVPIPTTKARRRERGFDGCLLIARTICAGGAAEVCDGLVQVAGDAQRGRGRAARLAAQGRFAWRTPALDGQRIILLDDVVTTGATLEDCAAVVRAAGGKVEEAVVAAIAS